MFSQDSSVDAASSTVASIATPTNTHAPSTTRYSLTSSLPDSKTNLTQSDGRKQIAAATPAVRGEKVQKL